MINLGCLFIDKVFFSNRAYLRRQTTCSKELPLKQIFEQIVGLRLLLVLELFSTFIFHWGRHITELAFALLTKQPQV